MSDILRVISPGKITVVFKKDKSKMVKHCTGNPMVNEEGYLIKVITVAHEFREGPGEKLQEIVFSWRDLNLELTIVRQELNSSIDLAILEPTRIIKLV
jgi:hypothetical protein